MARYLEVLQTHFGDESVRVVQEVEQGRLPPCPIVFLFRPYAEHIGAPCDQKTYDSLYFEADEK